MRAYPLIFGFRELVAGNGFVAGVSVDGRALLKLDDDDLWWVYGVQPGGISDYGSTEYEAYQNFRQAFREVLYEVAATTDAFDAFKKQVEDLCRQTNAAWDGEWNAARLAIRAGAVKPEGNMLGSLHLERGEIYCKTTAVCLSEEGRTITPADNSADEALALAAAA